MNELLGMSFHIMKRSGKCGNCGETIEGGVKSVVLGSFTNKYRYCTSCFLKRIELEFEIEILDFIKGDKDGD